MPLKHFTETLLVWILGAATVLTGVLIALLPALPQGLIPALILLVVTVAYPFALYPMLKSNRADYLFRLLHFAPAVMVILWLALQMLSIRFPGADLLQQIYTWGWTLPAVALIFVLLAAFCLHVIRRRVPRLTGLALLLMLFVTSAALSEQGLSPGRMTAVLPPPAHSQTSSIPNIVDVSNIHSAGSRIQASSSSKARLPSSGPRVDLLILMLIAGYCAVLHGRVRRRLGNEYVRLIG